MSHNEVRYHLKSFSAGGGIAAAITAGLIASLLFKARDKS